MSEDAVNLSELAMIYLAEAESAAEAAEAEAEAEAEDPPLEAEIAAGIEKFRAVVDVGLEGPMGDLLNQVHKAMNALAQNMYPNGSDPVPVDRLDTDIYHALLAVANRHPDALAMFLALIHITGVVMQPDFPEVKLTFDRTIGLVTQLEMEEMEKMEKAEKAMGAEEE